MLIADRVSNSVYRYSDTGGFINTVIGPSFDIYQAAGIGMSPDFEHLYVSSSLGNQVMRYDYDIATGTVSNATVFANSSDGIRFPNDIKFSPDGNIIYVANLSSTSGGVSRFYTDGSPVPPNSKLQLSTPDTSGPFQATSMNFLDGKLIAGVFADPQNTGGGAIAISDVSVSTFPEYLIPPASEINGATGLMIHDGFLYVSGLQSGNIERFALTDGQISVDGTTPLSKGQIDTAWEITGVPFPQQLVKAPDGNGFFAGILGAADGEGRIDRYSFDGTFISTFAEHAAPSENGFAEATAFVFVPTTSVGITGDFNNDGRVDAADYVVWRKASPSATLPNDDTPGAVDASDYADWRGNFGKSTPASGAALGANPSPEPAGALLLCIAILVGGLVRKRN